MKYLAPLALFALPLFAVAAQPPAPVPSGPPPGVVVDQTVAPDTDFFGSPSIAVLPDGTYVVGHDIFGAKAKELHTATVLESKDKGATWKRISHVTGQFWPLLFVHRGALYMLGTSKEYGDIVIRRSTDGGHTWTVPQDEKTGVIFRGTYHCAPVPFVIKDGRLWRGFERYTGTDGKWSGQYFESLAISVSEDADLLNAANWTRTNGLMFDAAWLKGDRVGWLEGNLVLTPENKIVNLLRVNATEAPGVPFELDGPAKGIPRYEVAARIEVGPDPKTVRFDPAHGFFHFPGSQSKFTIRFDPVSKRYWSLVQKITAPHAGEKGKEYVATFQRNVLTLTSSADLVNWEEKSIILRWREGQPTSNREKVGFQYVDWQIEGDDLLAVVRTAWNGQNYHNSNYVTFHRIKNFRSLTMADSPPDLFKP
jgi:hypothetical protein